MLHDLIQESVYLCAILCLCGLWLVGGTETGDYSSVRHHDMVHSHLSIISPSPSKVSFWKLVWPRFQVQPSCVAACCCPYMRRWRPTTRLLPLVWLCRLAGLGAAGSLSKPVRTTESLGRIKTGRRGRGPIAAPAAVAV